MLKKWLWCAAIFAVGAVTWNEYRLWTHRTQSAPMQPSVAFITHPPTYFRSDPDFPLQNELATRQAYDRLAIGAQPVRTGEEESAATVIDLSVLQRQTNEPPVADADEPMAVPPVRGVVNESRSSTPDLDIPLQFKPHSADPDDRCAAKGKVADTWKKITSFFWGVSPRDGSEESEPLQVMPRPHVDQEMPFPFRPFAPSLLGLPHRVEEYRCPHQGCPYLGGSSYGGAQYHPTAPVAHPAGEEQHAPRLKPKVDDKRKQPKLDTMEIRPGDIPAGWLIRPF